MAITLKCQCGKRYQVDDSYAGRQVACKACKRPMTIPAAAAPQAEPDEYDLADSSPTPARSSGINRPNPPLPMPGGRLAPVQSDGSSTASNPGRLYIETGQCLRCHMPIIITVAGAMVACSIGTLFFDSYRWLWWLPPLIFPVIIWSQFSELKKKMANGCICPVKVIKDAPYRVAVYTDLSVGYGSSHPAVYVMNAHDLAHAPGGPPKVGDRLSAVSYYSGPPKNGAWQGFSPTLVVSVTRNAADIARVDASIPDDEWAELDRAVAEMGDRKPGLYRLDG